MIEQKKTRVLYLFFNAALHVLLLVATPVHNQKQKPVCWDFIHPFPPLFSLGHMRSYKRPHALLQS